MFSGPHVWTADTASQQARQAWIHALGSIEARNPEVVVPGHLVPNSPTDISTVRYKREYLIAFGDELKRATDSSTLKDAMNARYPDAGLEVALHIGAEVATGENHWG
ncbi:hypothetical protein [Citrobacter sedlakii]|uniref:hypothetical protein n=1 Tax=Citrobacter sedlakii TaxID=67826 RepID=UPI0020BE9E68|nr:hypothetical protein [Citrobacter sedlakii]MCK8148093.1 hypothetical protein [Citrobacter sedlakii]